MPGDENDPLNEYETKLMAAIEEKLGERFSRLSALTVLRFVRGYCEEADPEATTIEMLTKFLDWREEKKVDELATKADTDPELKGRVEFKRMWPHGVHGLGLSGHPIYIERPGQVDPSRLMSTLTTEQILTFHIKAMEELCQVKEELSAAQGKNFYKQIVIMDLDGVGRKHCSSSFYGPLRAAVDIDQNYYPETLYKMFIVNAGWLFRGLWAVVSPWLHPLTQEKIQFGNDKMAPHIHISQIPRFLGGQCQCQECLVTPFVSGTGWTPPAAEKTSN